MDDYAEKQSNLWAAPQKNSNKLVFRSVYTNFAITNN